LIDTWRIVAVAKPGSASSLVGNMQWSVVCVASFFVSMLHDGTSARIMREIILATGPSSFSIFQIGPPNRNPLSPRARDDVPN
jgi:hypothetical protein